MRNLTAGLTLTVLAATFGGCASTSTVSAVTPSLTPNKNGAWLVFVAATEDHHRLEWEQRCVAAWHKAGLDAEPASAQLPHLKRSDKNLVTQVKAAGFDQLIVIDTTSTLLHLPKFQQQAPMLRISHDDGGTSVKHYRHFVDEASSSQHTTADIYPINPAGKTLRVNIESHEANSIKRISQSQCKALVNFIINK